MSESLWTLEDLAEVKRAIKELAIGKRLVRVSFSGINGSNQTNEYAPVDLPQLRKLRREMEAEIAAAQGVESVSVVASSKGLY
ncbi:hypothetical protein BS052_RS21165 [Vibrio parahaemolyticus]|nr:hypothetical protein [Vibrio parahaemolyticus]KOH03660.1 hypothetical protein ACZ98_24520 [Vibrio parahaemolyticus]